MKATETRYACRNLRLAGFPSFDDPVWDQVPTGELAEVESGKRPFLHTEFQLFRDDAAAAFYLKLTAEDDEVHSTYRLQDETLYTQDVFEIFISDTGRLDRYREIEVSPFDVTFTGDIVFQKDGARVLDMDWDLPGFVTVTRHFRKEHRTLSIWRLPYAGFAAPPEPGKPWRFNVFRVDHSRRGEELQAWQPTGARNFHVPERFAWLDFTE
jgi:hypothetical protein